MTMLITAIEQLTKTKYKVTFDEEIFWILSAADLRELNFEEDQELSEDTYERLYDTYVRRRAAKKALDFLERGDCTEKELMQKLMRSGFNCQAAAAALEYVRGYHYIDDERYARNFISYRSSLKSRQVIAQSLAQKGVSFDVIDACLEETPVDDRAVLEQLYTRKFGDNQDFSLQKRQKILNYFLRRGFKYNDIMSVIKDFDSI